MQLKIPRNRRLARRLGVNSVEFLEAAANSISRILPHAEAFDWEISDYEPSRVNWQDTTHRQINVTIGIRTGDGYSLSCKVRRQVGGYFGRTRSREFDSPRRRTRSGR